MSRKFSGRPFRERVELMTIPEPNSGCWLWLGYVGPNGYSHAMYGGKHMSGHRAAYLEFNGPIPDGMHVLHKCDVRTCLNPSHLVVGTHTDNMRDCARKGRLKMQKGERSANFILTADDVTDIRKSSLSNATLARRYGVRPHTIYKARNGYTWAHIK